MSEELWNQLQAQLAHQGEPARRCVRCWYREHPVQPFPAQASSSLCAIHAQETRTTYYMTRREHCP